MVLMCAPSIGDPEKSELVLVTPAGKQRLTRALVQGDHAVRMLNAADVGNPVAPLKPDMASSPAPPPPFSEVLSKAGNRALGGGVPGAVAMVAQVTGLMWLHTTLKYQYCHGTTTMATFRHLYAEGGVLRFYKGYLPALVQGPAIKFSQTASNAGMLAMLDSYDSTRGLPTGLKTMSASAVAASFRLLLMPIDTLKTMMQVEGRHGVPALITKCRASGPSVLFHGALAASGSTFVAHFTWFYTHNLLDDAIPKHCASHALHRMARNAVLTVTAAARGTGAVWDVACVPALGGWNVEVGWRA